MTRILPVFAVFCLVCMVAVVVLGLSLGNVSDPTDRDTQRLATMHRLSGVGVGLIVVLANSFVVTYFVGTSRWCKEVTNAYSLPNDEHMKSERIKRKAFPMAVASMLAIVGIVALGASCDPGAALRLDPILGITWSQFHLIGALLGTAWIAYSFYAQWLCVAANGQAIQNIMSQVRAIRQAKGLSDE